MVYAPEPEVWKTAEGIETDGRPNIYPSSIKDEFGFRSRPATLLEIVTFEGAAMIAAPRGGAIGADGLWLGAIVGFGLTKPKAARRAEA